MFPSLVNCCTIDWYVVTMYILIDVGKLVKQATAKKLQNMRSSQPLTNDATKTFEKFTAFPSLQKEVLELFVPHVLKI